MQDECGTTVQTAPDSRQCNSPFLQAINQWNEWSNGNCFLTSFVRTTMPWSLQRFLGASDVVQSVLIRVRLQSHQFQGDSEQQFRSWVLQIARRKIVDGMRRYRLATQAEQEQRLSHLARARAVAKKNVPEPDECAMAHEQSEMVLDALESLPADIRQVVMLRYTRELTFEQIADELGVSPATCRRRWLNGCQLLKEKMEHLL